VTVPERDYDNLMGKFSFTREERLSKEKWIKELFQKGSSFNLYPFRILFLPHPDTHYPFHQVLITVSVRNFKSAVDRNLVKRRIREAYRLQKHLLPAESKLLIAYIYTAREIEEYGKIEMSLMKTLVSISTNKIPAKHTKNPRGK
jgi:ribonuclease P protein component